MRVVGCLSWYDESPAMLAGCVASAARLCDHLVAVDGAFLLYPGSLSRPVSAAEQASTITETARAVGMGCTVHVPTLAWPGEPEKRSFLFQAAALVARPDEDWFLVIDADETLAAAADARADVGRVRGDVIEIGFCEAGGLAPARRLFRAVPGLRVEGRHFRYVCDRGELWGDGILAAAEQLLDIRLTHREPQQGARRTDQLAYYRARDEAVAEL